MKARFNRTFTAVLFVAGACMSLGSMARADQPNPAVVLEWNQIAQRDIGVGGQPFVQTRRYAMLHVAMADAVLAIDGKYKPFRVRAFAPPGASEEAAAAQAAHDVMAFFFPANMATYDGVLSARLASIPQWRRQSGVAVGKQVAAAVLAWRQNDRFDQANPQPPIILPSTLPGIWRPTPSGPAQYSALGDVPPFGLLTPTQFLPAAPPQLDSAEYADDFNEVKIVGRANSTTRTPEQTRLAQLFAGAGAFANITNPFRLWQGVARDVAQARHLSLADTARLFALLTTSIHDGLQASHTSKFIYRLWRPETAIAQAAIDNNADTDADSQWQPLILTPPYPSHSSNMACIGASAARMLADVFGTDSVPFTATWVNSSAAVVHSQPYTSFWAMAVDEGNSRVFGGVHFRFELTAAQDTCRRVADFIFANYLRARQDR